VSTAYNLSARNELERSDAFADRQQMRQRIAHFLDQAIWWGALAMIPLVAIPQGAERLWWQSAFEVYAFGLASLWLLKGLVSGSWTLRDWSLFTPLLALAGYALLQTLPLFHQGGAATVQDRIQQTISADVFGTYHFAAELLALIVSGALLLNYTRQRERLVWLIYVVIAVGVGSAAFGVFRVIAQRAWPGLIIFGQAQGDGFAQFANRNHFALLLEMVLGLVLGLLLGGGVKRQRLLLHAGLVLLIATTILLTTSRGGVLTMASQVLFLGLWFGISRIGRSKSPVKISGRPVWRLVYRVVLSATLIASLVVVLVIGIVNLGGDPLTTRMERLSGEMGNEEDNTHAKRQDIWRATSRLIKAHPFAGVGLGAYYTAIPKYHDASGRDIPLSALNDYLDLMAGGGLIGVALAVWFLILWLLKTRRRLKSRDTLKRATSFGALGGLFGLAAHSLVDSGLQVPINAVVLIALLVIAAADVRPKNESVRNAS
jgi:O-antigen ligase